MRKPQVFATIEQELYDQIEELARKNDRNLSQMVALLLQQAVKEKTRKRHGKAKNYSKNNSQNVGQSDRQ